MAFGFNMPRTCGMGAETVEQGTIFEYAQWFPTSPSTTTSTAGTRCPTSATAGSTRLRRLRGQHHRPREFIVDATGTLQNPKRSSQPSNSRIEAAKASDDTLLIIAR